MVRRAAAPGVAMAKTKLTAKRSVASPTLVEAKARTDHSHHRPAPARTNQLRDRPTDLQAAQDTHILQAPPIQNTTNLSAHRHPAIVLRLPSSIDHQVMIVLLILLNNRPINPLPAMMMIYGGQRAAARQPKA